MADDWKERVKDVLGPLGKPFVVIVYDTPLEAGGQWEVEKGVRFWTYSRVTPESMRTDVPRHIQESAEKRIGRAKENKNG